MAIKRKIYTAGAAQIVWTNDPQGNNRLAGGGSALPGTIGANAVSPASLVIQSLDWSKDIPKETITAFGTNAFKRIANEAESVEFEMELYPTLGIGTAIKKMAAETLHEIPVRMNITSSVGHCMQALMSSCEFEASVGDVPTMSLSFQGQSSTAALMNIDSVEAIYGQDWGNSPCSVLSAGLSNVGTTTTIAAGLRGGTYTPAGGTALDGGGTDTNWDASSTTNKSGSSSDETFNIVFPQSISFSWDGSVETIARLKDAINVVYAFGSPPGEASIECEGLADPGAVQWLILYAGGTGVVTSETGTPVYSGNDKSGASSHISIGAGFINYAGDLSSLSASNAVGELFQTFSTTTEGTAAGVVIV